MNIDTDTNTENSTKVFGLWGDIILKQCHPTFPYAQRTVTSIGKILNRSDSPWRKLSGIPLQPGRCQTGRDIQVRRWGCRRRPSSRSRRPSCSCSGCGQHRARQTPARSHKPPRTGCLQTNIEFSYELLLSQLIFAFIKSSREISSSYQTFFDDSKK